VNGGLVYIFVGFVEAFFISTAALNILKAWQCAQCVTSENEACTFFSLVTMFAPPRLALPSTDMFNAAPT